MAALSTTFASFFRMLLRILAFIRNFKQRVGYFKRAGEGTALKDANLLLVTDALRGMVLEGGLILKSVVSGPLKDINLPLVMDALRGMAFQTE